MTKNDIRKVLQDTLSKGGLSKVALASILQIDEDSIDKLLLHFVQEGLIYIENDIYYLSNIVDKTDKFSESVQYVVHYGGMFLLALANVLFFLSTAVDFWYKIVVGSIAVVFAFGEVVLWDKGVIERKWRYKLCGLGIALFSFIATASIGLGKVEEYRRDIVDVQSISILEQRLNAVRTNMDVIYESIKTVPAERITRRQELLRTLDVYTSDYNTTAKELESAKNGSKKAEEGFTLFILLEQITGVAPDIIYLVYLLLRSLMLEVVVLATTLLPRRNA